MSKFTVSGLPGVYNAIPITLDDEMGSALAVDEHGQLVLSNPGGTEYTDGGVPPTHPKGSVIVWSDGANWKTASTAHPFPVSESFGLVIPKFDYVSMALSAGDTTETYIFKLGGSGGVTVSTVVVVYTTSARSVLVSVTQT